MIIVIFSLFLLFTVGYDIFMVNYEVEELSGKKATKKKGLPVSCSELVCKDNIYNITWMCGWHAS